MMSISQFSLWKIPSSGRETNRWKYFVLHDCMVQEIPQESAAMQCNVYIPENTRLASPDLWPFYRDVMRCFINYDQLDLGPGRHQTHPSEAPQVTTY